MKRSLVLTGATGGLGRCVAGYFASLALAGREVQPVFCCRNPEKGKALCAEIAALGLEEGRYTLLLADLSSAAGAYDLAVRIRELGYPIACVVNNAGCLFPTLTRNEDGVEMDMAVNFLAPAIISEVLAPAVVAGGSIVNVLSVSRNFARLQDGFLTGKTERYGRITRYSLSKRALTVYTADMARRCGGRIFVNGVDPGIMNTGMLRMEKWFDPLTDLVFRPFTRKPDVSARAVRAACRNEGSCTGHIFSLRRNFPIERGIAESPWLGQVRQAVVGMTAAARRKTEAEGVAKERLKS